MVIPVHGRNSTTTMITATMPVEVWCHGSVVHSAKPTAIATSVEISGRVIGPSSAHPRQARRSLR